MEASVATAPAVKKAAKTTTYTILRKQVKTVEAGSPSAAIAGASGPDLYEIVGMQLSGSGGTNAIRAFVKEQKAADGVYVAVPVRSWTEKTAAFEATPQLKIT